MGKFKIGILFLVCVLVFGLSGCASTTAYKTAISEFKTASSTVITTSQSYLSEVNKVGRDAYIEECINNKESIMFDKLYGAQFLSSEALDLRLRALNELTNYGKLLYDLANSNSPEKLRTGFKDLGTALKNISDDVAKNSNKTESDNEFSKSIGPISEIFGVIAKDIMERKIQAALDKAVEAGQGQINKLMLMMRDEVAMTYTKKRSFYSQQRTFYVKRYNNALKNGENESSLRTKAEELKSKLDLFDALMSANPEEGFDAMIKAQAALVEYAKSPKKPKNLAAFAEAMDDFVSSAKIIADAVAELKKIK